MLFRDRALIFAFAVALGAPIGCATEEGGCASQEDCGLGFQCKKTGDDPNGVCEACPAEIQYDGLDNDCNTLTRDSDLDGDGDNAKTAATNPGGDCDDTDRKVSSKQMEVCGDGKDNDCDGRIDAPGCAMPPSLTILAPVEGGIYGGMMNLNVMASDASGIERVTVSLDGTELTSLSLAPYVASIPTTGRPDGQHVLLVTALSVAGAMSEQRKNISFDNTAPELSFMPDDGAMVTGQVAFNIAATDASGLRDLVSGMVASTSSPITRTIDFDAEPSGPFTVTATAHDNAVVDGMPTGNAATRTITVTAVNQGPEVTLRSPVPGRRYGGSLSIEGSATDPQGVASVELSVDGTPFYTGTATTVSATFDTRTVADGEHELLILSLDDDMNQRRRTLRFTVDNTAPTVTFVSPMEGAMLTGVVPVEVTASDPAGVRLISAYGQTSSVAQLLFNFDTLAVDNGPFIVEVRSWDGAIIDGVSGVGNVDTSTIQVTIFNEENILPTVSITSPLDGDSTYRAVDVHAEASSPSGISRVDFSLNGRFVKSVTNPPYEARLPYEQTTGIITVTATAVGVNNRTATASVSVVPVPPPPMRIAHIVPSDTISSSGFVVGDLDGDRVNDLVTFGSTIKVALGLGGGRFAEAASLMTGAVSGVLADVDGDTDLDIVAVTSGTVELYHNNGGTFGAPTSVPVGAIDASDVGVADLDGDGDADIIVSQRAAGADFVILHQNVMGNFLVVGSRGGVGTVSDLELVDVDVDGRTDIVLGRSGTGNDVVTVYRNADGSGTFAGAGIDTQLPGPPELIALGLLNGDNVPDLVALVPAAGGFVIRMGNLATPGRWASASRVSVVTVSASGISIGDVDGDGDNDLVVTTLPYNGARTYLNNGNGGFSSGTRYVLGRTPSHPAVVDFDGDGDIDIAAAVAQDQGVAWAEAITGAFQSATSMDLSLEPMPTALAFGDLISGPLMDFAIALGAYTDQSGNVVPAQVWVYRNDGDDDFQQVSATNINLNGDPTQIAIGDLGGTGELDLAVGSAKLLPPRNGCPFLEQCSDGLTCVDQACLDLTKDMTASLLVSNGNGYTARDIYLNAPRGVAIGDVMSAAGGEAVFSVDEPTGNGGVTIYGAAGTARFSSRTQVGATAVLIADLADPPGLLDVFVANRTTNNITLHRQLSGGFAPAETFNAFAAVTGLVGGLAAGDSRLDLMCVSDDAIVTLLGHPNFTLIAPTFVPVGATSARIGAADFNGDGLTDVVVLNPGDSRVAMLIGRQQGGFFPADFISLPVAPIDLAVTDLNGDGFSDLAVLTQAPSPSLTLIHNDR